MNKDRKEYYEKYLKISRNPVLQSKISKLYQSLTALNQGSTSPKFHNYISSNGEKVSLNDFLGSYVYIDVWATWCSPCKKEIPYLNKIELDYKNKNIKFVSISVDVKDDFQDWKNMIKEKKMDGIQLFADYGFDSQFIEEYNIVGIPHFILIDPLGNIVSANAPRPSENKLIELFNTLNL